MDADLMKEIAALREEFHQCKTHVGNRMVDLEVGNAEKLTRLETQMIAVLAAMGTFVTATRFRPVELIAFGLAGGVLTTSLGLVLARSLGANL